MRRKESAKRGRKLIEREDEEVESSRVRRKKHKPTSRRELSSRKSTKSEPAPSSSMGREVLGVLLVGWGIFLSAALWSYWGTHSALDITLQRPGGFTDLGPNVMGVIGGVTADLLVSLFGWCSVIIVSWFFLLAVLILRAEATTLSLGIATRLVGGTIAIAITCATTAAVMYGFPGGGRIGSSVAFKMMRYLNEGGTLLFSITALLVSLVLTTGFGLTRFFAVLSSTLKVVNSLMLDAGYALMTLIEPGQDEEWFPRTRIALRALWRVLTLPVRILDPRPFIYRPIEESSAEFVLGGERVAGHQGAEKIARIPVPRVEEEPKDTIDESLELAPGERPKISRGVPDSDIENKKGRLRRVLSFSKEKRKKQRGRSEVESVVEETEFHLPPLELLVSGDKQFSASPRDDELVENSRMLERTLLDFRVTGRVTEVHPGPIITLYEFQPAAGVKAQRVVTLADDLALALKVGSVRVYAPVPGKGTIGIEVPNAQREVVRLRDVLPSMDAQHSDGGLPLAVGKDTFGQPYVTDLAKMPHLLIAGATGTGKSVCINSLLLSLLYRNTPSDLRLILIDPKMLELSVYEEIPHLKSPVVTNPKHARGVLWWAVEEMERRYRLMMQLGVRSLANYNHVVGAGKGRATRGKDGVIHLSEKDIVSTATETSIDRAERAEEAEVNAENIGEHYERLPRIVIVVDELADLMLTVGREIEELLARLAQRARAAGIHLILATQRPSVDVITGLIKANFPARISFQVASKIDARTVMDTSGAEKLLGQGDMLFLPPGTGRVRRLHSAFVSDNEVVEVVKWIRKQGAPDYDVEIQNWIQRLEESEKGAGGSSEVSESDYDPLYDQALQLVVEKGVASTSMVQRAFRIGYNRAARILDLMEREGVVGPADGARPRQVFAPGQDYEL